MARLKKGPTIKKVTTALGMTLEQKIQKVKDIYIVSPRHEELLELFQECRTVSKGAKEPTCMLLTGRQGVGKTTTTEYYAEMHPRQVTPDGDRVPVVLYEIEPPATILGMVTGLLSALGDTHADRGNTTNKSVRLRTLLKECETELLILDEFQLFLEADSPKALQKISDWLKGLINKTKIPIVMCGMPYSIGVLYTKNNRQLRDRFQLREVIEAHEWDSSEEEPGNFRTFLTMIDTELPLDPSDLGSVETAYRIYCATNGYPRQVMYLIQTAAYRALERGLQKIDLELLAEVYERRYRKEYPKRLNPFNSDIAELEIIPFEESDPELKNLKALLDMESMSEVVKKR